ncbi:MAG: penicillin-binding protein 2 [Actinomycetes bacterium]
MRPFDLRAKRLFAVFVAVVAVAGVRAFWVTVVKAPSLQAQASSQQSQRTVVPAPRGDITDKHGTPLAVSEPAVNVVANPMIIRDPNGLAAKIAPILGKPVEEVVPKLSDRTKGFVYVARAVPAAAGDKLRALRIDDRRVDGLSYEATTRRAYPRGVQAGQLIGMIGTEGKGLSGLEYSWDSQLRGSDGERLTVSDARGEPILVQDSKTMKSGREVRLTIDAAVQDQVERVLAGVAKVYQPKGATAIVADPRNGELLALANYPPVDANAIASASDYAQLNKASGFTYEPGSTFKAVTVAAAMQSGAVTPASQFFLPIELQAGDKTISDSHDRGEETLPVSEILAQSSNVGAAKIGLKTGKERFDRWVRRFGFAQPTGSGMPGEERGLLLPAAKYSDATLPNMSMGQGLSVTPLQMIQAYATIANGGLKRQPRIVEEVDGEPVRTKAPERLLSPRVSSEMRQMLRGVLEEGGTASEAAIPGFDLAGKTGTAQKVDPQTGTYSESKYIASFIGFAPAHDPKLLVAVVVDEPSGDIYGGSVAAPAFSRIMSFALPYLGISPR